MVFFNFIIYVLLLIYYTELGVVKMIVSLVCDFILYIEDCAS